MPGKFCTQCGAENEDGKRFCRACGKSLFPSGAPSKVASEPPATRSTGKFCKSCGAPIPEGKPFCTRCGKVVELIAPPAPHGREEPTAPEAFTVGSQFPNGATQVNESRPVETDAVVVTTDAEETPQTQQADPPPAAPNPVLPDAPEYPRRYAIEEAVSAEERPKTTTSPIQLTLLIRTAVAVLIVVAVGASAWHYREHFGFRRDSRPQPSATPSAAQSTLPATGGTNPVNIPTPSRINESASPTPETQQSIPSASPTTSAALRGTTAHENTSAPSNSGPPPIKAPAEEIASTTTTTHVPTPAVAVVPNETVATPRSGTLHYSGPPVQYGGIVVFSGLPAGRLRFSFDHQAWQPLISRQLDGSQTLRLRSLQHSAQLECNVHWEEAP